MTNSRGFLPTPLARIGLIIPSSNRLDRTPTAALCAAGARHSRDPPADDRQMEQPSSALGDDIQRAAGALADAKCDIIVFHCTGHAMEEGPDGDARTRALIKNATGTEAISTASAIQEALDALQLKRLILLTPDDQDTNDHEIDYIRRIGLAVVHDVALALPGSDQYLAEPPERWVALAVEHARDDADGYFLKAAPTRRRSRRSSRSDSWRLGKPVVNSNQAVLWACMKRLRAQARRRGTRRRGLGGGSRADFDPAQGGQSACYRRLLLRLIIDSSGVTMNDMTAAAAAPRVSMRDRMAMNTDNALKIGLFGSNCSSGRAVTLVPERWTGNWEDNLALAKMSDAAGIEFMLPVGRWKGYGGDTDYMGTSLETITWATGLLGHTKRLIVFGTVHAPLFHPLIAAKQFVTADHVSEGRFGLNIVVGWNEDEFQMLGVSQRDHEQRYDYAQEWLEAVKLAWGPQDDFEYAGQFVKLKNVRSKPKPYGGSRPLIMNAGASPTGRAFAIRNCDAFFTQADRTSMAETARNACKRRRTKPRRTARSSTSMLSVSSPAGRRTRRARSITTTRRSRTATGRRWTASSARRTFRPRPSARRSSRNSVTTMPTAWAAS